MHEAQALDVVSGAVVVTGVPYLGRHIDHLCLYLAFLFLVLLLPLSILGVLEWCWGKVAEMLVLPHIDSRQTEY